MMKNGMKIFSFVLAALLLLSSFVACGNNSNPADTTAPQQTTSVENTTTEPQYETTEPAPDPGDIFETPEQLVIKSEGYSVNFKITRSQSHDSGTLEIKKAQYVRMLISDKIGKAPDFDTDWAKEEDSSKFEIIIGATDHPETEALLATMSYGDYAVRAVGNKIILMAFCEEGYELATAYLSELINKGTNKTDKTITLNTADLNKIESVGHQLGSLPTYDGGKFSYAYDAGRVSSATDCDQIIIKSTNVKEYDTYLSKLAANGYTKYTENEVEGNKFAIYTNGSYTVNVGFYAYSNEARLLIEPQGVFPTRAEDNKTEKVTTSKIMMLGMTQSDATMNGKCVIIRLEDGRFIVIDGGFNNDTHFNNFVKTIKENSKEYTDTPVIAAWIITHSHGDHTGLLNGRHSKIKEAGIGIDSFMYNEMSAFEMQRSMAYAVTASNKGTYNFPDTDNGYSSRAIIDKYGAEFGADVFKPHIGQVFNVSNLKMEVLYTLEGYAPKICNTMNTASIIIKMTITDTASGKTTVMLSTGDATGFAMGVADNIFGKYLKSDIITVNHHGYTSWGGDAQIIAAYKKVDATLLLWPLGDGHYQDLSTKAYNQPLFKNPSYKESYNSGDIGVVVSVPIPYVVGNVTKK